jgi:hypothetical protein
MVLMLALSDAEGGKVKGEEEIAKSLFKSGLQFFSKL